MILVLTKFSIILGQTGKPGCYVPPTTEGFTIHGLWPTNFDGSSFPEFCRPDMPFDPSKVQDLLGDLRHYWTDFLHKEPEFWEHEFEKQFRKHLLIFNLLPFF